MSQNLRILIIDDDLIATQELKEALEYEGYSVSIASGGVDGVRLAEELLPSLIILDVMMPGMDGFEVCRLLQAGAETAKIPILMLTARTEVQDRISGRDRGAIVYMTKPYSISELRAQVRVLLHRFPNPHRSELSITYNSQQVFSFQLLGVTTYASDGRHIPLALVDLNQELVDVGDRISAFQKLLADAPSDEQSAQYHEKRDVWRRQVKKRGKELHDQFVAANSDLVEQFGLAKQVLRSDDLLVRFIGPRAHLGLPWELLHDGEHVPLVIMHPSCRTVTSIHSRHKHDSWSAFLDRLDSEPLRVLLLASSSGTPLEEIQYLGQWFKQAFRDRVVVEPDPPIVLSRQQAEILLRKKSFHLIHYAGHSSFDGVRPDQSGLRFGSKRDDLITAGCLYDLLLDSPARLVFLNSCAGAQVGDLERLKDNDFLGLIDVAVVAGVPAVLGFRWNVTNAASFEFAKQFYGHLLETRSLEQATWLTRKSIYRANGWDETWLSPILVVQNPQSF
ncbi:MAG: CHAT domain-containing protein [Anaerolineae bacterium]